MQSTAGSTHSDVLVYNLTLQLVQLEQRFQQSEAADYEDFHQKDKRTADILYIVFLAGPVAVVLLLCALRASHTLCLKCYDSLEDSRLLAQQRRWGVGGLELHAARGAVAGGGGAAHDNLPAPPTPARNSFVGVQARTSMQPSPRFSSQLPPWLVRLSSTRIPRLTSFVSSSTGTTPAVTQQQAHADSAVKSTRDPEEAGTCTGPGMGQATLSLLPGAMPNISDGADSMPPTQCSIKEHSSVHASPLPITANQEPGPSSVAAADARNTACHVGASITAGGAGVASHIVIPILGDGTRSAVSAPTP